MLLSDSPREIQRHRLRHSQIGSGVCATPNDGSLRFGDVSVSSAGDSSPKIGDKSATSSGAEVPARLRAYRLGIAKLHIT